jgi:hypothetical protein
MYTGTLGILNGVFVVFLRLSEQMSGIVPQSGHNLFLSNPLQFIIQSQSTIRRYVV